MGRPQRLVTGLFLLLVFAALFAGLAPFTLGRVMLDLYGKEAPGRVTGKYEGLYWNRLRGQLTSYHIVVAFSADGQETREADYSVTPATFASARDGKPVDVVYWAAAPRLSAIEPTPWNSPAFLALFALALVSLWLCGMTMARTVKPPARV